MSYGRSLEMKSLIGKNINGAEISGDHELVVLDTDDGKYYLTWHGDCCARCFLANVSGVVHLIDSTILDVENKEWVEIESNDYDVLESMGTKINTSKGYVDLESRLSHNGYYGGWVEVTKEIPSYRLASEQLKTMKPLTDF